MIVGVDPGFANLGVVIAEKPPGLDVVFIKVGCMRTSLRKELSAAQDLVMRAGNLAANLRYFVEGGKEDADVYAVCVEGFSRPPSVTSAIKLGASHGIIGGLIADWCPEVIYVDQPQAIRKLVMGSGKGKTPPEEKVHEYLLFRYPELGKLLEGRNKGDIPHILDAAACVAAAYIMGRI